MKLSTLYTTVPDYIEFGWVTAPNTAGQSVSVDTITTLTLDTEVADTGSLVSAPTANVFTLPAGTYYYEAHTRIRTTGSNATSFVFALYNTSDSAYVSRSGLASNATLRDNGSQPQSTTVCPQLSGQFVIAASKSFDLRLLVDGNTVIVDNGSSSATMSDSTASADQRTTIKLWKLK